VNNTDNTVF